MKSSIHEKFLPRLRTNSLKLDSGYSAEFKSLYANAMNQVERKYKRDSQRRLMSINLNRTIQKTEHKLKRSGQKKFKLTLSSEQVSDVLLRVPKKVENSVSVMETRNATLPSPSQRKRKERQQSMTKEKDRDKYVPVSVRRKFFRGKNYEKQDKFIIAPWGTETNNSEYQTQQ